LATDIKAIVKTESGLHLQSPQEQQDLEVDAVLFATGRKPNLESLGLDQIGVDINSDQAIAVNEHSQTSQPHIYAVGDCTDRKALTPVAIYEGQTFADTVFGHQPQPVHYNNVPSSVFGQPQAAGVGLTQQEAIAQLGDDQIVIYSTRFTPLFYSLTPTPETTTVKLIAERQTERVLGIHIVGDLAAELIQMAAIAVTAGLTKPDFDRTISLHPTTAEEVINLHCSTIPDQPVEPCWMGN
jgi:glutathione reductase (NADPH)